MTLNKEHKKEIPICYCGGTTEIISNNTYVKYEKQKYNISDATVEKCHDCGDIFIQERTKKLIKSIVGYYPPYLQVDMEKQIYQFFN